MIINVNLNDIGRAATEVDNFVTTLRGKTAQIDTHVKSMGNTWSGEDKDALMSKWEGFDERGSQYKMLEENMVAYADLLRYSKKQYRTAQQNAINRFNRLFRF